ncbi:MAG: 3-hydroxyacyl-CoA dehydrogenase NAD-binding domain-containing protein, partial [Acidobacteriota bacterium]
MTRPIEHVTVIGAGTMGAAIAAHCANAGIRVLLLDIAPRELTEKEAKKGLSLEQVKNRIVADGLKRISKIKPPSFMSERAQKLVEIGNLDDDLERAAESDWIVEAVIEKLEIKRPLLERIEAVCREDALVTTNTSGLPIAAITEGRSESLSKRFFGTHFFNPPRYMKLLEVIPGAETDEESIVRFAHFATERLGKGVVICKDSPNFIGNRLLSVHGSWVIGHSLANGYSIEEVDAITGPLVGRPKTATFRLQDLVGIDVAYYVAQNLHGLIPDDPQRDVLAEPKMKGLIEGLLERDRKGNKSKAGFYRKEKGPGGKSVFKVLDPETFDYRDVQPVDFPAVGAAKKERELGARLRQLFATADDDRGASLARDVVFHLLAYAGQVAPDVAHDLPSVDNAVKWGFSYELGPFELWDRLGVRATADAMRAAGYTIAPWVEAMLDAGHESFYQWHNDDATSGLPKAAWSWDENEHIEIDPDYGSLDIVAIRADKAPIAENESASLLDAGDGVLLLDIHSKMNTLDAEIVAQLAHAREHLQSDDWHGLVIGTRGDNFSVGANLQKIAPLVMAGDFDGVAAATKALQEELQALRACPKPVVAAVWGMALGGGCELAMGVPRTVAAAESYIGLVEVGVGLVPGGGGLMELVRRRISPPLGVDGTDALPYANEILQAVGMAKVSGSAAEARELGFLRDSDRIVMNRDHVLFEAKQEVLSMVAEGWAPTPPAPLYAGGRDLYAALKLGVWSLVQAGWATEHDGVVANHIAYILAGG